MAVSETRAERTAAPYQMFMLVLSLWAIVSLAAGTAIQLDPETATLLEYADNVLCALFFADFLFNLYSAPKRGTYFVTWGWLDLLSSIPTVDALRWGRAARIFRLLRILRAVKSVRVLATLVIARRTQSALLAAVLMALLLIVFSSLAMLQFESGGPGNIQTAQDALWWSLTTMTTVGYGDTYPVSAEGRVVAVFLMIAGIGIFGTFSGLMASWFLAPQAADSGADLAEIKAALADIERRLPPRPEHERGHDITPIDGR